MMHHPVKSEADAAIDQVLAGMRSAQPSPGMERRLLETLRHHAGAPARPAKWPRPAALWSTACALAVLVAVLVLRAEFAKVDSAKARVPEVALLRPGFSARPQPPEIASAQLPLAPSRRSTTTHRANARPRTVTAPHEQRAASYPAPPMPLTEQEKLLLRLARKGEPVELAMLMPETRARRDAEGKAEFQKFFEPSTAANPKGDTK